ncbi:MAG: hypothetical protein ACIALR_12440 [Blastopirellula sp. JB062]
MSDLAEIRDVISRFWRLRIAAAGDLTLCRTLHVAADGVIEKTEDAVGGIGLALAALHDLTVQLRAAVTVVGDDGVWFDLKERFAELTFSSDYLQSDRRWTTPVDYEIVESGSTRRWRLRHVGELDESLMLPLQMQLRAACRQHDGLILVDRDSPLQRGVVDPEIRRVTRHIAEQESRKRLIVWSDAPLGEYGGCWRYFEPQDLPEGWSKLDFDTISTDATTHGETYFLRTAAGLIVAAPNSAAMELRATVEPQFSSWAVLGAIAAAGIAGADPPISGAIGAAAAALKPPVTAGAIAAALKNS